MARKRSPTAARSIDGDRLANSSRQQRTGQSGAAMHAEFCIEAALVRDDRAGRYPHRIRKVPARQVIREEEQAELLLTPGQRQILEPLVQGQCTRHLAVDRDADVTRLFGAVGWLQPIGTQDELAERVSQPKDRRGLSDLALRRVRQDAAEPYDFGQGAGDVMFIDRGPGLENSGRTPFATGTESANLCAAPCHLDRR